MKTSFNVGDLIHRVFEGNYWLYEVLGYEAAYEMYRIHRLVNSYKAL